MTYYKSSYLTLNITVTLKCGLEVTPGHRKWYHAFESLEMVSRSPYYGRIFSHFGDIQRQRMV